MPNESISRKKRPNKFEKRRIAFSKKNKAVLQLAVLSLASKRIAALDSLAFGGAPAEPSLWIFPSGFSVKE